MYAEWVPAGKLVKALVGFICSIFLCIVVVVMAVGDPAEAFVALLLISVMGSVLLVFWNYRGLSIRASREALLVQYGFLNRKSIALPDIATCEPTRASFRKYGGMGVRFGTDGSRAYTTSLGSAVRINPRKGRPFVFSSNRPEEICAFIRESRRGQ
ncbi:MAG: hypothetical protein NWE76_04065 [Candidatus Bathyarchaeota archaeon]|nr:hypothetical protein [Candidatus Bathyarchaeota archaeon]